MLLDMLTLYGLFVFLVHSKLQDRAANRQNWRFLPLQRTVVRGVLGEGSNKKEQLKLQMF